MTYQPSTELLNRINNDHTYHRPHGDQADRYERIREMARVVAIELVHLTPASREQSLALTHLEEVVFYSNAAIARNEREVADGE